MFFRINWLVLFIALIASLPIYSEERKPNVVFILADDLGWSDTSLYGQTKLYETPNLLRLAQKGVTFRRAYSASPLCSPTRASILTGLHPARIGLTSPTCHLPKVTLQPAQGKIPAGNVPSAPNISVTRLDTKYQTLGNVFQKSGYATGHFGKWHLGHTPYSPLEHGFQVDVPHWPGPGPAGSYVAPWKFPDFDPDTPKQHIEDRMAKEAAQFIKRNKDKPFFLNYWMFSVHAPFNAKSSLIEKYKAKIDANDAQRSPTYASMVESMDDAVGTLLAALEENGVLQNTIVVFFSDNGGNMYNEVDGTTPTSNRPLKGGKATMYEGGVRVPCIISYPGQIKNHSRSDAFVQSTDFFPTLVDLLELKSVQDQPSDGISLRSILPWIDPTKRKSTSAENEQHENSERSLFTYFPHQPRVPDWIPPSASIHQANWKLIRIFYGGKNGAHRNLLYDLKNDLGEQNNLANSRPDVMKKLNAEMDRHLKETEAVIPRRNPNFDFAAYDLAAEGKPNRKQSSASKPKGVPRKRLAPKVAGWRPEKDCQLKSTANSLIVQSTGNDPHFSFDLKKPLAPGNYTIRIQMISGSSGSGQLFWQEKGVAPKFIRDRSKTFDVRHDSKSHTYELAVESKNEILAIRLDPSRSKGQIEIREFLIQEKESNKELRLIDPK